VKCYEVQKCSQENAKRVTCGTASGTTPGHRQRQMLGAQRRVPGGIGQQLKRCKQCAYFITMNREPASCRTPTPMWRWSPAKAPSTRAHQGTGKSMGQPAAAQPRQIILDISRVNNIYSCGLGAIIKIHKEALAAKGLLVVVATDGYVTNLFTVTKLSRLLRIVKNHRDAHDIFDSLKKRDTEVQQKAAAAVVEAAKPVKRRSAPPATSTGRTTTPTMQPRATNASRR